jgi:hypothetical protein
VEKVEMTIKIDEYTLVSTFTIDPTKIDLKYNQDQSGLGDRNFGCHLCTTARSKWFKKDDILKGFKMNRSLSETIAAAELRRVNPDGETQAKLKEASKGVTHTPIYHAEHQKHLIEPLHNSLSFGRAMVDLIIRFNSDIFSKTIESSVQPLYEATKSELKSKFLSNFGFNPYMNLTGTEVATLYKLDNHEKVTTMVPTVHQDIFSRGGHNTPTFIFLLAYKLFPFSMPYRFQRHKAHLWEVIGSASLKSILFGKKYKGFSKFIKEKNFQCVFDFFKF